jgi:hypothetical protein
MRSSPASPAPGAHDKCEDCFEPAAGILAYRTPADNEEKAARAATNEFGDGMNPPFDRLARADRVARATIALLVEDAREEVTLGAVAERAGLSYWQVYRSHGHAKVLFRSAIGNLIRRMEAELRTAPTEAPSVNEGIHNYAAFAAGFLQSELYLQFAYLLIRDRCVEPKLEEGYRRIMRALRGGLETIVSNAGLNHGLIILLGPDAARELVSSLEAELALPKLLPGYVAPREDVVAAAIRRIANRTAAASYAQGSEAA